MLVEDPVKRVDNDDDGARAGGADAVPRPRPRRARGPDPAGAQARRRRQGRAQARRARRRARRDDRPAEGLLPRARARHPRGAGARARRATRSTSRAARDRGLFDPATVDAMLADPNAHRTNLDGSSLWQLGLLELWLQAHVAGAGTLRPHGRGRRRDAVLAARTASDTATRSSATSTCSRGCSASRASTPRSARSGWRSSSTSPTTAGDPAMANAEVLERIADDAFVTELGQFNVEINIPPRLLEGEVFDELEAQVRGSLNAAEDKAREVGAHMMIVGILPTLRRAAPARAGAERQPALRAAQRADLRRARRGPAALDRRRRAAQRVRRLDRARGRVHERAAAPARPSRGLRRATGTPPRPSPASSSRSAANSPFFFGKELWRETRIALFEQATDTRPEELKAQGVRPRVWFGERWITSIFDLFEENVRYFPALLPLCEDEDPEAVLERGDTPQLRRAQAPQRHRLPLEPAGLRGRPRPPARARGEPRAAGRPDRRRHPRQRRLLLRARAGAGRERAADLVADVVLRRGGQPARGRARRASTRASTGRASATCR